MQPTQTLTDAKSVYIIAGEISGDTMASKIVSALRKLDNKIQFYGVGGDAMKQVGITSLFNIEQISLMGFLEILPHIFTLKHLIQMTAEDIRSKAPDIVVTIDSPGFCYRVAKLVRQISPDTKLVHVVAPSVWVYKPERAKKFAAIYDHLLTLLSFEPPYFEKEGLASTFIGHPVFEQDFNKSNDFRARHKIDSDTKLIVVTPGSRKGEINRHMPIFKNALEDLSKHYPKCLICFTIAGHEDLLLAHLKHATFKYIIVTKDERLESYSAADVALAKSGTNTLEIAASNTPMIVAYKLNFFTALILKMLIKIKYASLINIIADREIIPEFLQSRCEAKALYMALEEILDNPKAGKKKASNARAILKKMGYGSQTKSSEKAGDIIYKIMTS